MRRHTEAMARIDAAQERARAGNAEFRVWLQRTRAEFRVWCAESCAWERDNRQRQRRTAAILKRLQAAGARHKKNA